MKKGPFDIIYELFKTGIVTLVFSLIFYVNNLIFDNYLSSYKELKLPIHLILILIFIFILIILFEAYQTKFQVVPQSESDYYLEYKILELNLDKINCYKYKRNQKIVALVDGLSSINLKFRWTGSSFDIYSSNPLHKIINLGRNNVFDSYQLQLNRTLLKGENAEIELNYILYNENNTAIPFLSNSIIQHTKYLKFILLFNPTLNVTKLIKEISVTRGGDVISSEVIDMPANRKYEWTIESPLISHHYEIRWA